MSDKLERIYLIVEGPEPWTVVKIGRTSGGDSGSEKRRSRMQTGNSRPLTVLLQTKDFPCDPRWNFERELHRWLDEHAIGGEWFSCMPDQAWHAVERMLYLRQHPSSDPNEGFFVQLARTLPDTPAHKSAAAYSAHATRARNRGDLTESDRLERLGDAQFPARRRMNAG